MNYKKHFQDNNYSPLPDQELCQLLEQAQLFMSDIELAEYVARAHIFNKGKTQVCENYSGQYATDLKSGKTVYWYKMREDLRRLPEFYTASSQNNLSNEQATQLLFVMMKAEEDYDFSSTYSNIELMTAIMHDCHDNECYFNTDLPAFHEFLHHSHESGDLYAGLENISVGIKAGMTPEQNLEIVNSIYKGPGIAGYVLRSNWEVLNLLASNDVDGTILYETLKKIRTHGNQNAINDLPLFMQVAVTHTGYSQLEIVSKLTDIINNDATKTMADNNKTSLLSIAKNEIIKPEQSESNFNIIVSKAPNDYFPAIKAKKLITGILPYRMQKTFSEGIHDLENIMPTTHHEGSFVFSSEKQIWYSLGGQTRYHNGGLRHEYNAYDISKLSAEPKHVHIHPLRDEMHIAPDAQMMNFPQLQVKWTKFLTAMPSQTDYMHCFELLNEASKKMKLDSYIVNSIGVTHMMISEDMHALERMGHEFRRIKDDVMKEFDEHDYLWNEKEHETHADFVKRLLPSINEKLPTGFNIALHAYDHI